LWRAFVGEVFRDFRDCKEGEIRRIEEGIAAVVEGKLARYATIGEGGLENWEI
jgi:hypothetical protein